jgi:hypothetical protein
MIYTVSNTSSFENFAVILYYFLNPIIYWVPKAIPAPPNKNIEGGGQPPRSPSSYTLGRDSPDSILCSLFPDVNLNLTIFGIICIYTCIYTILANGKQQIRYSRMQNTYSRIRNFAVCKTAEYKTAEFELPNRISNFMMTELYLPQIECQYGISNLYWR